jgi:hypothetical protein
MYVARIRFAFSPLGEAVTSLIVLRAPVIRWWGCFAIGLLL